MHLAELNDTPVKCAWGKESGDPTNVAAASEQSRAVAATSFNLAGYWHPTLAAAPLHKPHQLATSAAAAATLFGVPFDESYCGRTAAALAGTYAAY